ncbi:MAG: phosphotransferase family protein [Acidobacteriaceae bacterium]
MTAGVPQLPHLSIPRWSRPTKQIQAEIKRRWGIKAFILDRLESFSESTSIILAELLFPSKCGDLLGTAKWVKAEALFGSGLSEQELSLLSGFLDARSRGPRFSRLGWIHEALNWVEREAALVPDDTICEAQQWNGSSSAFLLQLSSRKGVTLWLKAVDPTQSYEHRITAALASIFPDYLPKVISSHQGWGAWLMDNGGASAADDGSLADRKAIHRISRCLAELQGASMKHLQKLLDCGCADWRLEQVRDKIVPVASRLEEAMAAQDVHGLPRFGRQRLRDICEATEEACYRLDAIGIPDTLIHNDLQLDNIIPNKVGCRFIDWDQGGIGNPFMAFEQLRAQLPEDGLPPLVSGYRSWWAKLLRPEAIDSGFALISPIAIAVQLCSYMMSKPRGATLRSLELRHLRSFTRQLDTALRLVRPTRRSA